MHYAIKLILITLVFVTLLSLWVFYLAIRPIRIISTTTPADFGLEFEHVSFQTADNITINGWFIPNKNPHAQTIILMHGYPADKGDILPSRIFLHQKYHLLFFDFRYLGESGGHYSTVGKDEVMDLQAAIQFLHKRNIHEVGVWGLSMGGAVALMAAQTAPEVKAIVAESPYARLDWMADVHYPIPGLDYFIGQYLRLWGKLFFKVDISTIQPARSASELKIPILLLFSKGDRVIRYQHAELMQETLKDKPNARIIIQEDAPHGALPNDYQQLITDFFDKAFYSE